MDEQLQTALLSQALWLAVALAGASLAGGPLRKRLGLVPGRLRWTGIALALAGFLALSIASDAALRVLDLREGGSLHLLDELLEQQQGGNALAALLILGLVPGVVEELLFRGFVQRILVARLGAFAGITGAAALFGMAHADLVHGSAAFGLGLFLGALAWVARSVWPPVLCHVLNNLLGVASAVTGWQPPGPSGVGIVGLVTVAGVALWSANLLRRRTPQGALQPDGGDAES